MVELERLLTAFRLHGQQVPATSKRPPAQEAQRILDMQVMHSEFCVALLGRAVSFLFLESRDTVVLTEYTRYLCHSNEQISTQLIQVDIPKLPTGNEPTANVEVEYVSREDLQPVEDAGCSLAEGLQKALEGDWIANCGGLLLLRRVIAHNKETAWQSM